MIRECLVGLKERRADRNSGILPNSWALRMLAVAVLAFVVLGESGCKDEAPGLTVEPLQSDPLPVFSDAAFEGLWLSEGEYVAFETKTHGSYLLAPVEEPGSSDSEDPIPFRLKRAGNLLMMEYTVKAGNADAYRPCWVTVNEQALEMYCLSGEELAQLGVEFETRQAGDDEIKLIRGTQEQLKQLYNEQALNRKVFEPTFRFTRPQPEVIARLKKKASRGNAQAQERLATEYVKGEIVAKDPSEALVWAQKAAESGLPSGQVLYGDLLVEQSHRYKETESDDLQQQARIWYTRAAESGFARAYSRLGHLYESSFYQDESSALDAYRRGAELDDPDSHQQLGVRYYAGRGVVQDEREAFRQLDMVPEADLDYPGWEALTNIYLSALDPELRNPARAIYTAEKATEASPGCATHALLARAYFENGQFERAVREQQIATCGATDTSDERVTQLAYYQSQVSGGYLSVATPGGQ